MTLHRMAETPPNTPSVVERTRAISAGAPVVAVHFLGRTAAFVLGEEAVLLVPDKGEEQRLAIHGGGILSAASDGVLQSSRNVVLARTSRYSRMYRPA